MPRPPEGDGPRGAGPGAGRRGPRPASPLSLLALVGPTGTGKSEVAFHVARRLDGEIVGCDALQVYRGLDAATAKPAAWLRAAVPHHLIDEVDPGSDFSLAEFVRRAERCIEEIAGRGRLPVVVGGTGLYLRGLLRGVVAAPPRDARLRQRLQELGRRRGPEALHRWLARRDPASARRLPPRDRQRVIRALELALLDGPSWSERLRAEGTWDAGVERYDALTVGLDLERASLGRRLDERVREFFAAGLIEEVRRLRAAGVPDSANAFKGIGYREVLAALRDGRDPATVVADVQLATRRYAKRQRTWFRGERGVVWLDAAAGPEHVGAQVVELWRRTLDARG